MLLTNAVLTEGYNPYREWADHCFQITLVFRREGHDAEQVHLDLDRSQPQEQVVESILRFAEKIKNLPGKAGI